MKQELYNFCQAFTDDRIVRIQTNIHAIQEALASETKSSAGDKHETGRAMLQLEREKLGQQLAEAEKTRQLLAKVNIKNNPIHVSLGSLVHTSKGNYFLAISAGEFKQENHQIFCISGGTPIGKLLLGKSVGNIVVFNEEEIVVLKIE